LVSLGNLGKGEVLQPLKIALVAPVWLRVPPVSYGGIEQVVSLLADGLVDRGHDVTLFASGDSVTKAKVEAVYQQPQKDKIGQLLPDVFHVGSAYSKIKRGNFDIVHDHTSFTGVVCGSFLKVPVLATLHGELNSQTIPFYRFFQKAVFYNAISEAQKAGFPTLNYVATVYNAIDVNRFKYSAKKEPFLLALSRISPQKGSHLAVSIAKKSGLPLILAGKVDPGDKDYFEAKVKPQIDGKQIKFLGEVSHTEKVELLAKAKALIFPIQWSEPFGLVMVEAMASGTPVIALNNGSVPELIVHQKTGYIANSEAEMVAYVQLLDLIKAADCRRHVEENFSPAKMVEGYLNNYYDILKVSLAEPAAT